MNNPWKPRRWLVCGLMIGALGLAPARAESPQRMVTEDEAAAWAGVARLNLAGNRFCTAVLISDHEVVTAAHCLFHPLTLHRTDLAEIKVVFGQRRSDYVALRGVVASAVLPGFEREVGTMAAVENIRNDLALLVLDAPVPAEEVRPFPVEPWLGGDLVDIVGYGRDRPYIASIREDCALIGRDDQLAELGCSIVPGLSGAAVTGSPAKGQMPPLFALVSAGEGSVTGQAIVLRLAPRLEVLRGLLQ